MTDGIITSADPALAGFIPSAWEQNKGRACVIVLTYEDADRLWDLIATAKGPVPMAPLSQTVLERLYEKVHDALAETEARGF